MRLYAHSAWSPGLIITFSNVLLGLFIRHVAHNTTGWFALPWVFFLLVQIHPSAAPLLLVFALYVLLHPHVLFHKKTVIALTGIITATAVWWIVKTDSGEWGASAAMNLSISPASASPWLQQ